jgi:hypothetical protein
MCGVCSSFTHGKPQPDHKIGLKYSNLTTSDVSTVFQNAGIVVTDMTGLFTQVATNIVQPGQINPATAQSSTSQLNKIWVDIGRVVATIIGKK